MRYTLSLIALGSGANAFVARDTSQQCIQIEASGGASGILGQLDDGQNRIGGNHPTGCYCLSNGGFTDSQGRGCILTPPTTQFQCDTGASPTTGFSIGSNGAITYNGSGKFYACPVNDYGEYNVYTTPAPRQTKCVEISLSSGGACGSGSQNNKPTSPAATMPASKPMATPASMPASMPAPMPASMPASMPAPMPASMPAPMPASMPAPMPASMPAPMPASMPAPMPMASSSACPADLSGEYQYPHLIVPVDSQMPGTAYGTSYNGKVNSHICSIFNFDIPSSYSGKTCTVVFLFPEQKDLETSSYTVSGSGQCTVSQLKSPASQQITWSNQPAKDSDLWSGSFEPGNSYTISSGDCAAGQTVSYEICSSGDYSLEYFQDYNPSPIGLYVREC
jgi:hypothetical protein